MKDKVSKYTTLLFVALYFFSCSPTKYIPEGEYLLESYKIKADNNEVLNFEIDDYIKQKPNKKILGVPVYARIYNLVDPVKEEKREEKRRPKEEALNRKRLAKGKEPKEKSYLTRWLRKIGEEPVIYSSVLTRNTTKQIETLLANNGYYDARVKDTVKFLEKRAYVNYYIESGKPYTIRYFNDTITDVKIRNSVHEYLKEHPVKSGKRIVGDELAEIRADITRLLVNKGYFKFSNQYILFEIDTIGKDHQADITLIVKDPVTTDPAGNNIEISHEQYSFDNFYIYPDYEPENIIHQTKTREILYDTISVDEHTFILVDKKNRYRNSVLTQGLLTKHDSLYSSEKVQQTFRYYGFLSNFRLINIKFDEKVGTNDSLKSLDTHIRLTPSKQQSFTIELEGNYTSGKYGMGTNLNYQHLNLFGGAEIFNLQFKVELNNQDPGVIVENSYFNETEYGVNASILFPKLISPFKLKRVYQNVFPKTNFSAGYHFWYNSNYRRTVLSTIYGYRWKTNERSGHDLNPLEFNLVRLTNMSPKYLQDILATNQFKEKYDHIILNSSYTFTYNTQDVKKKRDFIYLRSSSEAAGNILNLIYSLINPPKMRSGDYQREVYQIIADSDSSITDNDVDYYVDSLNRTLPSFYTMFNLPYAQYFKTEIDFRYYDIKTEREELVYRINPGIIFPYGNSYYSPQEKQFFLGGASSMRAWQARTLGPGSYSDTTVQVYQYGDIKLEMNIEYRFKMFWIIEGALFADAGNIWSIGKYEENESKVFRFNHFYKEIALGAGFGTRFDFSFFIIRFDFGLKIYNPSLPEGNRWINSEFYKSRNWTFNFGIGYPF